ncbi:uroporphyrinogen-III synthase [Mesorhizobium sp. WSM4303]|uniref:uroporphyrinogen-III synthase n=1 Tax=unclassified Mesorhizobium TaxID=325217 RepID=UPI00115C5EE3|nr:MULTISPECIES: uroporphyrinogen-III synthase [unclassified Mesorhizobium]TRC96462.1 uroporphyrinogen-III synthase [Mesorhizobium sp. WSM4306]TRD06346.1 uroporphyrinogen-III synthase [Mesorhizobium sp. WSM4303]
MRVLVTRPQPGASRTERRLQELGFEPILLPLTETVALPVDASAAGDNAVAVAITSANAVRRGPKGLIAALADMPCHAVGARTAEAARAVGFLSVSEGPGDAEKLADTIAAGLSGKAIVYLTGRVRFSAFETRLRQGGVEVRAIETYDTVSLNYSDDEIRARLSGQAVDAMLLYSAKAAAALQTLVNRPELRDLFENARVFALSERIAAAFGDVAGKKIVVAREPQEEALLERLRAAP